MDIREAVAQIIGQETMAEIDKDLGFHWAIVAAVFEARLPEHAEAITVIRAYQDTRSPP